MVSIQPAQAENPFKFRHQQPPTIEQVEQIRIRNEKQLTNIPGVKDVKAGYHKDDNATPVLKVYINTHNRTDPYVKLPMDVDGVEIEIIETR